MFNLPFPCRTSLSTLYHGEVDSLANLSQLREVTEISADGVAYLHAYIRLNFIGFRKITKKYDKHNKSASSGFYLARLVKEPFVNLNFDFLIELVSIVFSEMRRVKRVLLYRLSHHPSGNDTTQGGDATQGTPGDEESAARATATVGYDEEAAEIVGYDEDDVDLDSDHRGASSVGDTTPRAEGGNTRAGTTDTTTYLVGEADLMR